MSVLMVVKLVVGERGELWIDVVHDGWVSTFRRTTPIISIEELE